VTEKQDKPVGFEMAQHVAWRFKDPKDGHWLYTTHLVDLSKKYWRLKNELFDPLYTAPPQRPWVDLTDEEVRFYTGKHRALVNAHYDKVADTNSITEAFDSTAFYKDVSAVLKERNT